MRLPVMHRSVLRWSTVWLVLHSIAAAQYQVVEWANFEDGTFPRNTILVGQNAQDNIKIVDLSKTGITEASFRSDEAKGETGGKAVLISSQPDPKKQETSQKGFLMDTVVDRDTLGDNGRALYQCDFYIGASGNWPSIAVLAVEDSPDIDPSKFKTVTAVSRGFYRFGFTKNKTLYWSCVLPTKDKAAGFQQDLELMSLVPRPGWHRFAIVFEGSTRIHCYVDGRATKFSPANESTLRKLRVGVLLADPEVPHNVYVDNISIQVSKGEPIMPVSPYASGWKISPGEAKLRTRGFMEAAVVSSRQLWKDPEKAWSESQKTKKPFLLYFYAPGIAISDQMDRMLKEESSAEAFLAKFMCARADVNQLQGGVVAEKYGVFKVPAMLVIDSDGKRYKLATLNKGDTWQSFIKKLDLGGAR